MQPWLQTERWFGLFIDEDKIADEIYTYNKVFINKALVINKAQNCSNF